MALNNSVVHSGGFALLSHQDPANDNAIFLYLIPKQPPWLFECDGDVFLSLSIAEARSKQSGQPIYCRPKKAASK